ncbi:MAG: hypothetical protein PHH11_12550, partial [Methylomonas sp.]|nr:hypothetical protein [Methylomonas sp.]
MNRLVPCRPGLPKGWLSGLGLGLLLGLTTNSAPAAVAQVPLFLSTGVEPNVLFNMSIETPMGGAAYNDQADGGSCKGRIDYEKKGVVGVCYFPAESYLGYFDPNKCYSYNNDGGYFQPDGDASNHECSEKFSGNFMNWATMTAMDMFVWTMTGGNRIDDGADGLTVVKRTRKHDNDGWFQPKLITKSQNVAPSTVTPWDSKEIYIYNTSPSGVKFGTTWGGSDLGTMNVNIRVCDKEKTLEANCVAYDNGKYYKPEGLVQKNADHMRFGVTSYSNSDKQDAKNGGVLRSNIKYVGTLMPDGNGGTKDNANKEIGADGTIILNSNPYDAAASKVTQSGVIPYLNKFSDASYKAHDPASELFYESVRYFKNLGPTPEYLDEANGGFPILGKDKNSWQDPITQRCQKNFIIGINDANPWKDKKLPGTFFTDSKVNGKDIDALDIGEPSNPDPDIDVRSLTNKVGDLEKLTGTSQCIGCTANKCDLAANKKTITKLGEVIDRKSV